MPDWQKVGTALSGFGAGLQGQGPQWQMARVAEQKRAEEARIQQDAERQRQMLQDMYMVQQSLANGDTQSAQYHLEQRIKRLAANGEDTSGTQRTLEIMQKDPNRALNDITASIKFFTDMGGANGEPADVRGFNTLTEGLTEEQRNQALLIKLGLEPRAGISADERVAQNPELMAAVLSLVADRKGAETAGGDVEERRSERIAWGYDAAKGLPTAKRALQLLKSVKTGGVDAVDIKTRRLLGAESADQGELSNLLGKAVLSQLKATFGPQFTEKEGRLLLEIEAGIEKGEETNIRLLNQLVKRSEVYARRAIQDATSGDHPDYYTAASIQELLDMDLGEGVEWLGGSPDDSGLPEGFEID